jgi:hypothetical protein
MKSVHMTISGGRVLINLIWFNSTDDTFLGGINSAGEVSAPRVSDGIDFVTGTIVGKMFKGGRRGFGNSFHACFYSIEMEKQSPELAPTTFDGQRYLNLLNLSNTFARFTIIHSLSHIYEIYKTGDHEHIYDAWSGGEEHEAVYNIRMFMKKNGDAAWTVWHTLENLRDTATDPGEQRLWAGSLDGQMRIFHPLVHDRPVQIIQRWEIPGLPAGRAPNTTASAPPRTPGYGR